MTDPEGAQRSGEACPECGRHELELISYPDVDATGVRPYDELLGFGAHDAISPRELVAAPAARRGRTWARSAQRRAVSRRRSRRV